MSARRGFSLIELLVVVAIIAGLVAILLPSLASARRSGQAMRCLANLKGLETAHWMYMNAHNGAMIDVGLGHGGSHANDEAAWINTLSEFYGNVLLARSPLDTSPYWAPSNGGSGQTVPGADPSNPHAGYRRSSYGVNDHLTAIGPGDARFTNLNQVPSPQAVVHFVIMDYVSEFAAADHVHAGGWGSNSNPNKPLIRAANEMQYEAVDGEEGQWTARSNYGFLDGHAETRAFEDVYASKESNHFNPHIAR